MRICLISLFLSNLFRDISLQCNAKVAVLGASGGIGQPLSLLLKESCLINELSLYDIVHTPGVAADLSHINTPSKVKGYTGPDELKDCVKGAQVFILSNAFEIFTRHSKFLFIV